MGRGRLRRGCSLEVIFEEDPDFCSHLDSLDGGVAIRFGIKEPDDTISLDSLLEVEEYQVRFEDPADAEQVFRSLDGFIDVRNMDNCMVEWDEFSMDSNFSKLEEETVNGTVESDPFFDNSDFGSGSNGETAPSGRRSRVSRRQIIQATWLGYSSSSDESVTNTDPDDNDNSGGRQQQRRRSPSNRFTKSKLHSQETDRGNSGSTEPTPGNISSSSTSVPRCITTAAATVTDNTTPNLVTSVEDFLESDGRDGGIGLKTPIQIQLHPSPTNMDDSTHGPPPSMFGRTDAVDILEKDTLDSYISTMTDETDTNAYTFADPFDDTNSVASTSYESSGSTSSTESNGSVCTVNSFSMQSGRSKSNGNEGRSNISPGGNLESRTGGRSSNNSGGNKYRSNLKVELVSQLNKSQEGNLHSTTTPASSSVTMNPSNLRSGNSYPNLQSSTSTPAHSLSMSGTTPSTGISSKYPNHQQKQLHRQQPSQTCRQSPPDQERQSVGGDVKRVRALFELRNHSRTSPNGSESNGSSSNGSTCPSSPESTSRSAASSRRGDGTSPVGSLSGRIGLYSKNGRRSRGSPQNRQNMHSTTTTATTMAPSSNKALRSTYANLSLNQTSNPVDNSNGNVGASSSVPGTTQPSYDYVDLLVNENIVIEDAPDIFQQSRSRRQGNFEKEVETGPTSSTAVTRPVTLMNLSSRDGGSIGALRRSRSMGTGISSLGSPAAYNTGESGVLKESSSKTNILAEELPAPDTVKNVRNVFENMLKMRGNGSDSSVDTTPSGFSGSFSIVKKSLSYIKSNPTSRIYRSESMRDDFPTLGRRYGKPVLMSETSSPAHSPSHTAVVAPSSTSPSLSTSGMGGGGVMVSIAESVRTAVSSATGTVGDTVDGRGGNSATTRYPAERKVSEPAKFSPKINTGLNPSSVPSMLRSSFHEPLTEEGSSLSSNVTSEDYRSRKYVHPDVLQKIRSAGTTTTYFGGRVVAKTIKTRKIPVTRRHTFDFQDYVGISGDGASFTSNYDSYSCPNYYRDDESPEKRRGDNGGAYGSSRPALDIPLKSSSANNIYAARSPSTISGALDSIFGGVGGLLTFASKPIDTTPRIISVLPKSPPGSHTGSPVKSCSPVSSVIEEGRNSPEGCEASNEKTVEQDGNNNNLPGKVLSSSSPTSTAKCNGEGFNKKFSQITEGAWF